MSSPPRAPALPFLDIPAPPMPAPPGETGCVALWNKYGVPDHIRAHSRLVAAIALKLADMAKAAGADVDIPAIHAAGLLHDLAKMHTVRHGGNHAQMGAAWARRETGNQQVAHGILHHVRWPWPLATESAAEPGSAFFGVLDRHFIAFAILYADKRVRHSEEVNMDERFEDIYQRYGISPLHRERIAETHRQAVTVERLLSARLGVDLHAYTFDSGRLVK